MKPRSVILTCALGLAIALLACQDQTIVVPDGVTAEFAKVKPCTPWPSCDQDDGDGGAITGFELQDVGSEAEPEWVGLDGPLQDQRAIQVDNATTLDVQGPDVFFTALSATYTSYLDGQCLVDNPRDVDDWIIDALATELSMVGHQAVGSTPTSYINSRILIDKVAIASGSPSEGHMVSIGFESGNPLYDFGAVWIAVGGGMLQDLPDHTVVVEDVVVEDVSYKQYTFSGGAVRVVSRAWKPNRRPSIECLLKDPVVVLVKTN